MRKSTVVVVGEGIVRLAKPAKKDGASWRGTLWEGLPSKLQVVFNRCGVYRITRVEQGGILVEVKPTGDPTLPASYETKVACRTLLSRLGISLNELPTTVHIKVERLKRRGEES